MKQALRPLFLVALTMAWHEASDRISDRYGIDTESFASPWKFPLIALGLLVTLVGILGVGVIWWGKTSLRELGWTRPTLAQIGVGLGQTAICCGMIAGVYAAFGQLAELGKTMASLTLGQRVFFAVMGVRNSFFEETLFRGDLQKHTGVIVSSAVFALHHRTLAPIPLAMKFAMGIIFALSAWRMRSLVPSGIAHALVWAIMANA